MRVRKRFTFEAAHRLCRAESERCRGIHGHSYKVELMLRAEYTVGETGMVLDFKHVKSLISALVDKYDHSLVISADDPLLLRPTMAGRILKGSFDETVGLLNPRYIITPFEPTAEMMAGHFFYMAQIRNVWEQVNVECARVWETETGWAECDRIMPVDFEQVVYSEAVGGRSGLNDPA